MTIRPLPDDGTMAGTGALVAVSSRTGRLCGILQCRLEIPRVAVLIEREAHNSPELPSSRLDILGVEVRVTRGIGGRRVGCDNRIKCLATGAHDEFAYALPWVVIP